MITNQERLEKFIEQVQQLARFAEEIRDRDVYPVSFFSQAFDIAGKIQEDLQQIELCQIQYIANQMDERQLQILSAVRQSADSLMPEETNPVSPEPALLPEQDAAPVYAGKPEQSVQPDVIRAPQLFTQDEMVAHTKETPPADHVRERATPPVTPPPAPPAREEKKATPSYLFEQKQLIDLKKMMTLNDRFLFCRELFANNENLMNQVLSELNREESYDASIDYLQKRFDWNFDDKNVTDFIAIVKKRFS